MGFHPEAFLQQSLKHGGHLIAGGSVRELGVDVEAFGAQPFGSGDLVELQLSGHPDVIPEVERNAVDLGAVDMDTEFRLFDGAGIGWPDGGDFELLGAKNYRGDKGEDAGAHIPVYDYAVQKGLLMKQAG